MNNLFIFSFFKEMVLATFWSTWLITLLKQGVDLKQGTFSIGLFFIGVALCEFPTGIAADRYGRKLSSLLGLVCLAVGFAMNAALINPIVQLFSFILAGLGFTLVSGANTAWFLSILSRENKNFDYEKYFLEFEILGRISTILGSFVGVYFMKLNPSYLWLITSSFALLAIIPGALIPSDRGKVKSELIKPSLLEVLSSLRQPLSDPVLIFILLSVFFFGIETAIRSTIYQPFILSLKNENVNYLAYFQSSLAFVRLFGVIVYRYFLKHLQLGPEFSVLSLCIFALAEFIAYFAHSYGLFLLFYCFGVFTLGWYFPVRSSFISQRVGERNRATLLSIDSMILNCASGVTCFILAFFIDGKTLQNFWLVSSLSLCFSAGMLWFATRVLKTTAENSILCNQSCILEAD